MKRQLTEAQKAHADKRRARGRELVKQIKGMTDDQRQQLARSMNGIATCEGRGLSLRNTCLLAVQCPGATVVGGYQQWRRQGRNVRKGEHGHIIWIPRMYKTGNQAENGDSEEYEELQGFMMGNVFDIGQTEELGAKQAEPVVETTQAAPVLELALA